MSGATPAGSGSPRPPPLVRVRQRRVSVPLEPLPEGQRFTSNMAVTLTAEPIFGRAMTLAECATALSQMSLESVVGRLVLLKHINEGVLCDSDTPESDHHHRSHLYGDTSFRPDEMPPHRSSDRHDLRGVR